MPIVIKPFTEEFIQSVREFNLRLTAGGQSPEFQFPEDPVPKWLPKSNRAKTYQEYFLALEENTVRGGYILKHQDFSFDGEIQPVAYFRLPLSEGTVNKNYIGVGVQMLRNAIKTHPLLFGLGMGGYDRPLPRMLKALGWSLNLVSFFFKVIHPRIFLKEIRPLRKTAMHRAVMDFAAITGSGGLAIRALQSLRTRPTRDVRAFSVQVARSFSGWADDLWEKCRAGYSMIAVRNADSLSALYPEDSEKVLRLQVSRDSEVVGWAVVLNDLMCENKYFGKLRVGTVADYLALPGDELQVILEATRKLEEGGADLVVCNESNANWTTALRRAGFLHGPSRTVFAASRKLAELLHPIAIQYPKTHLNFGDGDGPFDLYR